MLDAITTAKLGLTEQVAHALNGIGVRPVLSGSVGLKLCLSRYTNGRIDDVLKVLPTDDIDLFVPATYLSGEGWEKLVDAMSSVGFSRDLRPEALPHDFVSEEGQVVSFGDEDWPEMGIGHAIFVADEIGDARILSMPIDMYEFLYERLLNDGSRLVNGKGDAEKLRLVRRAADIVEGDDESGRRERGRESIRPSHH